MEVSTILSKSSCITIALQHILGLQSYAITKIQDHQSKGKTYQGLNLKVDFLILIQIQKHYCNFCQYSLYTIIQ